MPSASFLAIFIVALIGQVASDGTASTDGPRKCTFYTGANTNSATCNEIPDLVCNQGCQDSFVTAEGCLPNDGSGSDTKPTTQLCNVGFGRDTARAKGEDWQLKQSEVNRANKRTASSKKKYYSIEACLTLTGGYSCTGKTSGYTNCYGCVNTRITFKVPLPSENVPDSWVNASHVKPVPSPPPVQLQCHLFAEDCLTNSRFSNSHRAL
ncbi:hypothetical protein PSTT_08732 [Puccinia striiformis]|uniref:Secreted protein n=1 Tax=Puccinia striiformis TaxID=27350 RepID=A0A2S4VB10_9BASI|nr:hypothetical protein PSTT_08732 [Puccinia striiformis]